MMNTFEELLDGLRRAGVELTVVGGVAVALNGYTRAALDLDILIEASPTNVRQWLHGLQNFGTGSSRVLDESDFELEEGSVRIMEDFALDIYTIMKSHTCADLLPFTAAHDVQDYAIRYLNPEGLVLLKADSTRPKDRLDVEALLSLHQLPSFN